METILAIALVLSWGAVAFLALELRGKKRTVNLLWGLLDEERDKKAEEFLGVFLEHIKGNWQPVIWRIVGVVSPLFSDMTLKEWEDVEHDILEVAGDVGVSPEELKPLLVQIRKLHDGEDVSFDDCYWSGTRVPLPN